MRDYGLLGEDGRRAVEGGLTRARWYRTDVPADQLKALMQRSDRPALRDTALWLGAMVASGGLGIWWWPSAWAIVPFFVYGVLYGSGGDSRWHECGHGTAFKTRWMNRAIHHLASFMMVRNPVAWRWSHSRHHAETAMVGRDPEIAFMRPPRLLRACLNVFGLVDAAVGWSTMLANASGRVSAEHRSYIPEREIPALIRVARIWTLVYALIIILAVSSGSILPLMIVGLPRLYGAWHHVLTGSLQHAGLAEDALDHRMNTRTLYLNPLSRFVYWNMNYHVEHHMFPTVPYHALPALHELIKHDLPAPNKGLLDACREVGSALRRQRRDAHWYIRRILPITAVSGPMHSEE